MIIKAEGITKLFGSFKAISDFNLEIKKGECFGLLGPNGAGKSTFINMTYGTVERTSGNLRVFELDPRINSQKIKSRLGVVTQDNALDESLSVLENMLLFCSFVGVPKHLRMERVLSLLEFMNLAHKKDAPIISLSGGMKRRLVFVRALLNDPELLILDEPTTGLDPAVRHLLWGKVRELHQKGTTILLTTHYMHEAEVLCDRLVIMNGGKIEAEGSPQKLISKFTPGFVGIFNLNDSEKIEIALKDNKSFDVSKDSSSVHVRHLDIKAIIEFQATHNLTPLQNRPSNLEDVFLKLTGKDISADA